MAASEHYLEGGNYDTGNPRNFFPENDHYIETADNFRNRIHRKGSFEKLSARDCIQAYSTQYVSSRGDLLLVQNSLRSDSYRDGIPQYSIVDSLDSISNRFPSTSNQSYAKTLDYSDLPYVSSPITYPSYDWMCPSGGQIPCKPDPGLWMPYGDIVQYCWSEKAKQNCQIRFSLYFAITVIICNFVKVISMFMTFKTHKHGALITLGDAIESFLDHEDVTTRGLSIYSSDRIQLLWNWEGNQSKSLSKSTLLHETLFMEMESKQWEPKRWYWGSAATRKRWAVCFAM